ncbi:MAG: alpha/beta hydrolase [Sinobacteraceae bacterium]|nr:alpha/beta hydrolase [Nevskiaceae bacterium]MCP5340010.1 alpha/beta hydrolase [Nevskiaceae bacterium]MCP5359232.1 alpha/beta hydrolase [Nevskiaceae bacterium]
MRKPPPYATTPTTRPPRPRASDADDTLYGHRRPACKPVLRTLALILACLAGASIPDPAGAATGTAQFEYLTGADGVPLCVLDTGNPQGRELLLIHGFSQSYAVFKQQYQGPLAADHRIVAFDLRGHGCSGKPWVASAYDRSRTWADDVDAVIRAKHLGRPLIVAWSFGGYVAAHYVKHHGTAGIAGLVLVGSHAGLLPPPTDPALLARLEATRAASAARLPDIEAGIAEGHGFVKAMTVKPAPADLAEIMFASQQMLPPYARRAMAALPLQLDEVVPQMTTPTLLLVGDQDRSQSIDTLTALSQRLPDGHLQVIEGAGHATFIDAPQAFAAAILAFENQVQAAVRPGAKESGATP